MNPDQSATCLYCRSTQFSVAMIYETKHNGARQLFRCQDCTAVFSATHGTPMGGGSDVWMDISGYPDTQGIRHSVSTHLTHYPQG